MLRVIPLVRAPKSSTLKTLVCAGKPVDAYRHIKKKRDFRYIHFHVSLQMTTRADLKKEPCITRLSIIIFTADLEFPSLPIVGKQQFVGFFIILKYLFLRIPGQRPVELIGNVGQRTQ